MFVFDPLYFLLVGPALLLAIWAQAKVSSTFHKYDKMRSRGGLSGAEVARLLLRARGLDDVKVEPARGFLTDHYDPRTRTLRLSEATFQSNSVAALGVAAHEAGHALQHADAYAPLTFRNAIVPVVSLGSNVLPLLVLTGIFLGFQSLGGMLGWLIVGCLAVVALFSIVTLPVELDASRRALATLSNAGVLVGDEMPAARAVLKAAALTYVAAAASAVLQLLYFVLRIFGGSSHSD